MSSDPKFISSYSKHLFQKKEDDVIDSCPEEYESDDDIVYLSSSRTLDINEDDMPEGRLSDVHLGDVPAPEDKDGSEDADESEDADDDEDEEDGNDVKDEVESQAEVDDLEFDSCRPSMEEKPSQEAIDKLEEIRAFRPENGKFEQHCIYIHGYYYCRRKAYGGYGIIILNSSRQPIAAYCGASKGGSYLYHLLVGIKRGLQIASKRGLSALIWDINSDRVALYFNHVLGRYSLLRFVFHSQYDAAYANICWKCMRRFMFLTGARFKELVPVIKDILKLQYDTKFQSIRYCQAYSNNSAYNAAKCGAQALLRREAEFPGEEQKIEMKMQHPEKLTPKLKREKTSLGRQCWYVLQRRRNPRKPEGPPSHEIQEARY